MGTLDFVSEEGVTLRHSPFRKKYRPAQQPQQAKVA
jgi:hypothetical protein